MLQCIRLELDDFNAITVDDTDGECAEVYNEALLELVNAAAKEVKALIEAHVGPVVAVHGGHCEEGAVPVCRIWHCRHGAEIVDPVESWFRRRKVEAAKQDVDLVGVACAQRVSKLFARPRCCRSRS